MAVIPSRLAGMGQSAETWLPLIFGAKANPSEQRAAERHEAWRQNLAAVRAQAAQAAAQQARAQGMITPQLLQDAAGKTYDRTYNIPEAEAIHNPHESIIPEHSIQQPYSPDEMDIYKAQQVLARAHGTNMPGGSALARLFGAGSDADADIYREPQANALASKDGMGFSEKQRAAYQEQSNQSIAGAMDRATAGEYGLGKLGGIMASGQEDLISQYQDSMLQDVWAVATKLAHNSNLIDANTAFNQIMQAMAQGKIDPVQIKQTANIDDGSWGGLGADKQELAIEDYPENRQQRLNRLAKEFGELNKPRRKSLPPLVPVQ